MGAYQYQALNPQGRTHKGVLEADSERHARRLLRDQGLVPTSVSLVKKRDFARRKNRLSPHDLTLFTRQLATLISAGLPIDESLHSVAEQSEQAILRQLIIGVRSKIVEGYGLAEAMAEYPDAFPELYRATIGAGEQTGRLDLILEKLADYTEKQQETRQKIQHALIYPTLMICLSSGIVAFLLAFVVPKIIDVFQSSGQALPAMTMVLLSLSNFLQNNGLFILLFFLISIPISKNILQKNLPFRKKMHKFLLKILFIKPLIQAINVARYTHTFSILFRAGVSVLDTMRVSSNLVSNLHMREAFDQARVKVREGMSISQALKETTYLGSMATHLIASGEKSGQLAEMMERSSQQLENEVRQKIDTALTLLEPAIILLMGAVVLFIVLATLLPIFTMEQLV